MVHSVLWERIRTSLGLVFANTNNDVLRILSLVSEVVLNNTFSSIGIANLCVESSA